MKWRFIIMPNYNLAVLPPMRVVTCISLGFRFCPKILGIWNVKDAKPFRKRSPKEIERYFPLHIRVLVVTSFQLRLHTQQFNHSIRFVPQILRQNKMKISSCIKVLSNLNCNFCLENIFWKLIFN